MSKRNEGKPISSPDNTLEVALSLARQGWPVFPVKLVPVERADGSKAVDKRPLVKWLEGATTDHEQIALWWGSDHPGAWIGVHAERAGIVVDLDLDKPWHKTHELAGQPKGDGKSNLKAAGIDLPKTFRYKTHSGGVHCVYKAPKHRALTIARDIPVPGVDIRAGRGLMVYYGPALAEPPTLAKAPEWSLIDRVKAGDDARPADGDIDHWLTRADNGEPTKGFRQLLAKTDWQDLAHDDMLGLVSDVVKRGGERGAATVYKQARDAYLTDRPDRARDWDNAARGSIGKHGTPPATLSLSKDERKALKRRNDPERLERQDAKRKADWRVAKHVEANTAPKAGVRILEDSPLAVELAEAMADHWAWSLGRGLMRYDGKVWGEAQPHALTEEVRDRLNDIEVEEHAAAVHRGDNKGIDKARTLLSRNRARAVGELVLGRLALTDHAFDGHKHLLNTPSGIVDLRTSELLPHDPKLLLTKITSAPYEPDADDALWRKALEALPPKVADYLQVRLGQSATGHTPDDDVLTLFEGAGENGKTSVLLGIRKALGDYAVTVPDRLLAADPGDHPTTLMLLMGARLAVFEELPEGRNLNIKRLKDAVGTPFITARRMRQDDVTFAATHALVGATNYLPIVAETDHGTWRRLELIRFPYRYVKRRKDMTSARDRLGDRRVKRALSLPDAGVLRWLVEGARLWYENGERMPEQPKRVKRDTLSWRLDADPVLGYVDERIEVSPGHAITTEDLARDFNDYIEGRGHRRWSSQTINARFEGHVSMDGVERRRVRFGKIKPSRTGFVVKPIPANTQAWVGIKFKSDGASVVSEAERDALNLADLERRASG